jgi:hypothetical protein
MPSPTTKLNITLTLDTLDDIVSTIADKLAYYRRLVNSGRAYDPTGIQLSLARLQRLYNHLWTTVLADPALDLYRNLGYDDIERALGDSTPIEEPNPPPQTFLRTA